ncbi:MAG: septum formation initiator family protein [Acidimicrobiales bacterium]
MPPGDDSVASGDFGDDERGDDARKSGMRRLGRFLGFAGGGAAVLGAVAIGLFPTQTFLDQRASTSEAQQRLAVLREQNASFKQRIDRLGTDAAIERLAREQYNLAFPGEEAYAVLPAPLPPLQLPALWPFGPLLAAAPAPAVTPAP